MLARLRIAVAHGACASWDQVRQQRPEDHWYAFALYTSGDGAYTTSTMSSEEGLDEVAHSYAERTGHPFLDERMSLRWSPCDSPYHCAGEEHFMAAQQRLDELYERLSDRYEILDTVFALCRDVLRQMDAEGRFGRDKDREKITLNLLMGDQSDEERLEWAKELNPPVVAQRLAQEFEEAAQAWARWR